MAQPKTTPATPSDEIQTPGSTTPNSYGGQSANPTANPPAQGTGSRVLDQTYGVGYGGSSAGPAFQQATQGAGSAKGAR